MRISDWSSDVCSSDLKEAKGSACADEEIHGFLANFVFVQFDFLHDGASTAPAAMTLLRECLQPANAGDAPLLWSRQIGRASCRERVLSVRVDLGGRRIIQNTK